MPSSCQNQEVAGGLSKLAVFEGPSSKGSPPCKPSARRPRPSIPERASSLKG